MLLFEINENKFIVKIKFTTWKLTWKGKLKKATNIVN